MGMKKLHNREILHLTSYVKNCHVMYYKIEFDLWNLTDYRGIALISNWSETELPAGTKLVCYLGAGPV